MNKQQQFELMLDGNKRRLTAIARSYAAEDDRQDLYQEMLLQIWQSLARFEGRSVLDTWIYRVALNTAISYRRKTAVRTRRVKVLSDVPEPQPAGSRNQGGPVRELQLLDEFIGTLNKVDRAVFLLYLEDIGAKQMSEITGLTENNIGVKISRIKKAFVAKYLGA